MYLAINAAVAAYNAIAVERGLPGLSLDQVIEQCGVSPETFANTATAMGPSAITLAESEPGGPAGH